MSVRRAFFVSTADRYVGIAVSLISLPIIARVMPTDEFGVAVIGQAISAIAISARDFASQTYLINRKELDRDSIRSFFTLMILSSLLISGIIMLLAPWFQETYQKPGIILFLALNCLALTIEPFHLTIGGLLRRDMAFGRVMVINVTCAVLQASSLVGLAWGGFGFLAFGYAWAFATMVTAVVAIAIRPDLSIFRPSLAHVADAVRFGGYNGAASLLYRLYESVPLLALGHILSVNALGSYYRAATTTQLPDKILLGGIMSVALPAFAKDAREGRDLRASYLRAIELVTAVQWPALILVALLAEPIVRVVLGEQWLDVAPLLRLFAIAWTVTFYAELNYPVLVATGGIRLNLIRAAIVYPPSAAIVVGAAYLGLQAVVLAQYIVLPFQALVSFYFVRRSLELPIGRVLRALPRSAVATAAAAVGPIVMLLLHKGPSELALWEAAIAVLLAVPGWLLALSIMRHPMWIEIGKILRFLMSRSTWSGPSLTPQFATAHTAAQPTSARRSNPRMEA